MNALAAPLGRYRKETALAIAGTVGEVMMEAFLPLIMARIIDEGVEAGDMGAIVRYGALMALMAALSLCFGLVAGYFSAKASVGYGCGLREAIFDKVQTYSFANIDRFSTAGLVTRMTTDVTNLQNALLMLLRVAVRSPIMLISSLVACAAVADPPALILDEATSSIDTRTEEIVAAGMDALMAGRTTFVIAHRLSTVKNADCICVMEHGHIVERGSHDELMAQRGRYWQLYTGGLEDD